MSIVSPRRRRHRRRPFSRFPHVLSTRYYVSPTAALDRGGDYRRSHKYWRVIFISRLYTAVRTFGFRGEWVDFFLLFFFRRRGDDLPRLSSYYTYALYTVVSNTHRRRYLCPWAYAGLDGRGGGESSVRRPLRSAAAKMFSRSWGRNSIKRIKGHRYVTKKYIILPKFQKPRN